MKKFSKLITEDNTQEDIVLYKQFISDVMSLIKNNETLSNLLLKNGELDSGDSDVFSDGEYLLNVSIVKKP